MYRFAILLTVCLLFTGTVSDGAVPITDERFALEYTQYVYAPCMAALLNKAGILDLVTSKEGLPETEQMALFLYRFDKTQLAEFNFHLEHRKSYLANTVKAKPAALRQAWYAITVKQCMKKLPD